MAPRLDLQAILIEIVGDAEAVYFQPKANIEMQYPCIVYEKNRMATRHANNLPYHRVAGYQVTVIDRNPDSQISEKVARLPMCSFDRHFVVDQLHHEVYTLFF